MKKETRAAEEEQSKRCSFVRLCSHFFLSFCVRVAQPSVAVSSLFPSIFPLMGLGHRSILHVIFGLLVAATQYVRESSMPELMGVLVVLVATVMLLFIVQQLRPSEYELGVKFTNVVIIALCCWSMMGEAMEDGHPSEMSLLELNLIAVAINAVVWLLQMTLLRWLSPAVRTDTHVLVWDYSAASFLCSMGVMSGDSCDPYRKQGHSNLYSPVHGHAALAVVTGQAKAMYLSWWPTGEERVDKANVGCKSAVGRNNTMETDVIAEGKKNPLNNDEGTHHVIVRGLHTVRMLAWWEEFRRSRGGRPLWKATSQNCSSIVIRALDAGGACAWYEFWRYSLLSTPSTAIVFARTTNSWLNHLCCFAVRTILCRACILHCTTFLTCAGASLLLAYIQVQEERVVRKFMAAVTPSA